MRRPKRPISRYRVILVLTSVAAVAALLAIALAFSAMREAQRLRREQHEYRQAALATAVEEIDARFGLAWSLMKQFWHNASSDILPYLVNGDHSPMRISRIMRALRISQDYFTSRGFQCAIIDPENQRFISNGKYSTLPLALEDMGFSPALAAEITELKRAENLNKTLYLTNDRGALLIVKPWSNATVGNVFIECYHFDMNTLQVARAGLEDCGLTICLGERVLYTWQSAASASAELAYFSAHASGARFAEAEKDGFRVTPVASRFFGLEYLLFSPVQADSPEWPLRPATMIAAMALLGISIAYFSSFLLYRPVRRMVSQLRQISPDAAGAGALMVNEFDMVEHTLHGMRTTIDELRATVSAHQPSLREKALRDLLLGLTRAEEIPAQAADLDLPLDSGRVSLSLIEVRGHDDLSVPLLAEIHPKVLRVIGAHLHRYERPRLAPILQPMSLRRFVILSALLDMETLSALASAITREMEQSICFETTSAIVLAKAPEEIPDAYDTAFMMLRSAQFRGLSVHTPGTQTAPPGALPYAAETERELIRAVLDSDEETTRSLLLRIFAHSGPGDEAAMPLGWALATTARRVLQRSGVGAELGEALHEAAMRGMGELQAVAVPGFVKLASAVASRAAAASREFSDAVLHYIDEHYAQDLSLPEVAEHFGFSSVYMSTLFKNATGTNFKDYLALVRVRHAKALLQQELRVYEVAAMVGCNTPDTFIRMFKRVEGVSPGRYQQDLLKQSKGDT